MPLDLTGGKTPRPSSTALAIAPKPRYQTGPCLQVWPKWSIAETPRCHNKWDNDVICNPNTIPNPCGNRWIRFIVAEISSRHCTTYEIVKHCGQESRFKIHVSSATDFQFYLTIQQVSQQIPFKSIISSETVTTLETLQLWTLHILGYFLLSNLTGIFLWNFLTCS